MECEYLGSIELRESMTMMTAAATMTTHATATTSAPREGGDVQEPNKIDEHISQCWLIAKASQSHYTPGDNCVFVKSKINGNNQNYFPVQKPNSFDQALCSVERHSLVLNYPFAALWIIDCSDESWVNTERMNRSSRKNDRRSPETWVDISFTSWSGQDHWQYQNRWINDLIQLENYLDV